VAMHAKIASILGHILVRKVPIRYDTVVRDPCITSIDGILLLICILTLRGR